MKQKAIIVDLDGTLCDTRHRQHHMAAEKKNWMAFYEGISQDEPNQWCLELVRAMAYRCEIVFVSGRPDTYREITEAWLKPHLGLPQYLYMRREGDFRKDSVVKEEIYRRDIEPKHEILFCIDDRQQVVDAWRELGLVCLQCAKGDF